MFVLVRQLSHDMVKVMAARRSPPRSNAHSILVCLRAYTDPQLVHIMESLFCQRSGEVGSSEDADAAAFLKLCEQALPFITLKTRHVDEVWAHVSSVWSRQQRRAKSMAGPAGAGVGGRKRLRGGDEQSGVASSRLRHSTEDDVAVVLLQPVPHCSSIFDDSFAPSTLAKECYETGGAVSSTMDSKVCFSLTSRKFPPLCCGTHDNNNYLLNIQKSLLHVVICCAYLCVVWYYNVAVLAKGWCMDLSVMARVMLLAAFLASRNPQETDRTTFGNALKGRRKKPRQGVDGAASSKQQDIYDTRAVPRAFGLERLLAIYLQILPAAGIARKLTEAYCSDDGTDVSSSNAAVGKSSVPLPSGDDMSLTNNEALIYSTVSAPPLPLRCFHVHNSMLISGQFISPPETAGSALSQLGRKALLY